MTSIDPAELLARVAQRYATLRSYRDEGEVIGVFLDPLRSTGDWDAERVVAEAGVWERKMSSFAGDELRRSTYLRDSPGGVTAADRKPFRTWFVRPDRFRFEFRENPSSFDGRPEFEWNWCCAWLEKGVAKSWWTLQPTIQERASIFDPLGASAGISGGASLNVAALLMPGWTHRRVLPQPDMIAEVLDDHGCHRIERFPSAEGSETLWIDKESSLLRRLRSTTHFTKELMERQREHVRSVFEQVETQEGIPPEQRRRILEDASKPVEGPEFVVETVTNYRSEADVEIPEDAFAVVIPSSPAGGGNG